jgi:hypothetical protein
MLQAGIPGVLLAPNDNPPALRTAGGVRRRRSTSSSYRRSTGMSRSHYLFGTTVGHFTGRLMEWVYDEGHCARVRDWDWVGFGLRLAPSREPRGTGAGESGGDEADEHADEAELFAKPNAREVLAPVHARGDRRHTRTARAATGRKSTVACVRAFVKASMAAAAAVAPPTVGEQTAQMVATLR